MSKTIQQTLHEAKQAVLNYELGKAIATMAAVYAQRPSLFGHDSFKTIHKDYSLMVDFMMRGYKDNQRSELYKLLLHKLYALVSDLEISWRCKNVTVYVAAFQRAARLNLSPTFLREVLERFVTDVTLLSLEDESTAKGKRKELYERHQTFADRLFCSLFVACQWTDEQQNDFRDIILLPTIDTADALLMATAITLSVLNQYDPLKVQLLAEVYRAAQEPALRQRALVGFIFSLRQSDLFRDHNDEMLKACLDGCPRFKDDLVDLQKQVFFCFSTEKDTERIQKDIMPGILKNSNIRVTRFGIEEKEPDALEDILHPEAEDKAMEEVERAMDKMREMLKAGSDIFFGGFAQMKRFPFFSQLSNWFTPFTTDHPALSAVREKLDGSRFLENMLERGAFCDSDKYSFALALAQVIDRLPKNIREMLGTEEAMNELNENADIQDDVHCRRFYLQDLYRFFRLHPFKEQLANPFAEDKENKEPAQAFFLACPHFQPDDLPYKDHFVSVKMRVARFLYRRHDGQSLFTLFGSSDGDKSAEYYFIMASASLWCQYYDGVVDWSNGFFHLSEEERNHLDDQMLRLKATALLRMGRYDEAETAYAQLVEAHPDELSPSLNLCIAQLEALDKEEDDEDEAVKRLFKLNYQHPDNLNVVRVLAWGLLKQYKCEQAERYYRQILDASPTPSDWLNAGYSAWLNGHPSEARDRFMRYLKESKAEDAYTALTEAFERDGDLLETNELDELDQQLMVESIALLAQENQGKQGV